MRSVREAMESERRACDTVFKREIRVTLVALSVHVIMCCLFLLVTDPYSLTFF